MKRTSITCKIFQMHFLFTYLLLTALYLSSFIIYGYHYYSLIIIIIIVFLLILLFIIFFILWFLLVSYNIFLLPVLESKFILYRDYLHYEPVYVE